MLRATLRTRWVVARDLLVALVAHDLAGPAAEVASSRQSEDRGTFMAFAVAPEGATMQYTDGYMRDIGQILKDVPEIETLFEVVAPGLERPNPVNLGIGFAVLKHWDERERNQLISPRSSRPSSSAGCRASSRFTVNPPSLGGSFLAKNIDYVIYGNSYEQLQGYVEQGHGPPGAVSRHYGLDTDLKLNKPQLRVEIDRDKASALGVSMATIGSTLETLMGGRDVTRYKREGKQYDVVVQMEDDKRRQPSDLTAIYVRGNGGELHQLSNLVTLRETVAPKELNHFNKLRASIVNGNVAPGYAWARCSTRSTRWSPRNCRRRSAPTSTASRASSARPGLEALYHLGAGADFHLSGAVGAVRELRGPAGHHVYGAARHAPGRCWRCGSTPSWETGGTLNVYSQIGLVMLVGLITKNGILIVEFANQLRRKGAEKFEAVVEASTLRLRPDPDDHAGYGARRVAARAVHGAGAEARQAIGWVIVGGMTLGTLLTLFVIPDHVYRCRAQGQRAGTRARSEARAWPTAAGEGRRWESVTERHDRAA